MAEAHTDRARAPGTLYLVGTPIGNLSDITLRAVEVLKRVPRIAAEDTRRTRALLSHLGLGGKRLHSVNANTSGHELTRLLDFLVAGDDMALVTDAGMPSISDPGAELVSAAASRGIVSVCIPGPSAVTTAAALSGMVSGPFLFLGFLPRKGKKRAQALARIQASSEPVIVFESPLRTAQTLSDLATSMPDRRAALCRELTKLHEEVVRAPLAELAQGAGELRGEVTLVIEGKTSDTAEPELDARELDQAISELVARGDSVRDIVQLLLAGSGMPRQALYARVQAIRDAATDD